MEQSENENLLWQHVSTKEIVRDPWIDFRSSVFALPDGRNIGPFYTYHRSDYVVIVATDEDGNYLCVRQFRQGIRKITTEFPAGGMNKGEEAIAAGKRELLEETGYVSKQWELISRIPSNATISDDYAYILRAKGCRKESVQTLDPYEFIETALFSPAEMQAMIAQDEFAQAVHVMAYYRAK